MQKARLLTAAIIIGAIVLAGISFLLPTPKYEYLIESLINSKSEFQSSFAFLIFSTTIGLGVAALFLLGTRQGFSNAFRRCYYWITAGFVLQVFGSLAYVYNAYSGLLATDFSRVDGEIPLALGIMLVFYGFYCFAQLLQLKSLFTNLWFIGATSCAVVVLTVIAPHNPGVAQNEFMFDLGRGLAAVEAVFYIFCAVLAWQIHQVASYRYAASMLWSVISMATAFISACSLLGFDYLIYPRWLTADAISSSFIITNVSNLVAAYMFNKIAITNRQEETDNPFIGSIMLLASLASKPREIEPILENLRGVTASHETGKPYTNEENNRLSTVYQSLEDYLVNREQVRTFSSTQLKDMTQERFGITRP